MKFALKCRSLSFAKKFFAKKTPSSHAKAQFLLPKPEFLIANLSNADDPLDSLKMWVEYQMRKLFSAFDFSTLLRADFNKYQCYRGDLKFFYSFRFAGGISGKDMQGHFTNSLKKVEINSKCNFFELCLQAYNLHPYLIEFWPYQRWKIGKLSVKLLVM